MVLQAVAVLAQRLHQRVQLGLAVEHQRAVENVAQEIKVHYLNALADRFEVCSDLVRTIRSWFAPIFFFKPLLLRYLSWHLVCVCGI